MMRSKKFWANILPVGFVILLIGVYFLVRIPGYTTNLQGEDGDFANIFENQPPGPAYLQAGRVLGKALYIDPWHPAANYEILRGAGFLSERIIDFSRLNDFQRTVALHALFSVFQLVIWLLFILAIFAGGHRWAEANRWVALAGILVISITPMAIENSVAVQIDSTSGVLLVGLASFCLLWHATGALEGLPFYGLLFLTSLGVGLGKNEWSLLFIVAVFMVSIIRMAQKNYLARAGQPAGDEKWLLLVAVGGCIAGNGLSYAYDSTNYLAGWGLMLWMSGAVSVVGHLKLAAWLDLTLGRLPYIVVIFFLLVYTLIRILQDLRTVSLAQLLLFTFAGCLFGAFFFSAQVYGGVRYFAPALVASTAAALAVFLRGPNLAHKSWYAIYLLLFLAFDALGYPPFPPYREIPVTARPGCIQILATAQGYHRSDVDYIGDSIGPQQVQQIVDQYGEPLCKPLK